MPCPIRQPPSTWYWPGYHGRELADAFNRVADSPIQVREAGRRPGDVVAALYIRMVCADVFSGWHARYDIADGIRHSLQWAAIRDEVLSDNEAVIVKEISSSEC